MNIPNYDHKSILSGSVDQPKVKSQEVNSEDEENKEETKFEEQAPNNQDDADSKESDVHIYYTNEEIAEIKRR